MFGFDEQVRFELISTPLTVKLAVSDFVNIKIKITTVSPESTFCCVFFIVIKN
eukprot:GAHX01004281.1.p2 GENE.GAHX01004281.1~~GAHX01004281.1.p2  ORF type:complete len:53 (+),score=9.66 GAHX01004281.1:80-238(+)